MMALQTSMDYEMARDHMLNLVEIDRADKAHEDVKCKLVLKEQKANAISKEALARKSIRVSSIQIIRSPSHGVNTQLCKRAIICK